MYRRPILCACRLAKANKDNPEEADEQTANLCFAAEPKRELPVTKESADPSRIAMSLLFLTCSLQHHGISKANVNRFL